MKKGFLACPACGNPTKEKTFSEFYIKEFYKKDIFLKIENLSKKQLESISNFIYFNLENEK